MLPGSATSRGRLLSRVFSRVHTWRGCKALNIVTLEREYLALHNLAELPSELSALITQAKGTATAADAARGIPRIRMESCRGLAAKAQAEHNADTHQRGDLAH